MCEFTIASTAITKRSLEEQVERIRIADWVARDVARRVQEYIEKLTWDILYGTTKLYGSQYFNNNTTTGELLRLNPFAVCESNIS